MYDWKAKIKCLLEFWPRRKEVRRKQTLERYEAALTAYAQGAGTFEAVRSADPHRKGREMMARDFARRYMLKLESQAEASKGLYKHVKTEGLYYVITEATLETTGELVVVYRSVSDGHDWVRPADEFFDGRFVRLEEAQK